MTQEVKLWVNSNTKQGYLYSYVRLLIVEGYIIVSIIPIEYKTVGDSTTQSKVISAMIVVNKIQKKFNLGPG